MGFLRGFTKNWANTTEPTHSDLAPITFPKQNVGFVRKTLVDRFPRSGKWSIKYGAAENTIDLVRTTRLGFRDDVVLTLSQVDSDTVVHAESRSRIGKGDLGQNRRNILELWSIILKALT